MLVQTTACACNWSGALAGTTRAGTYLWCARPSSPRPRHDRAKPTRTPPPRRRGWDTKKTIKLINNVLKGNYAVNMPLIEEVALGGKPTLAGAMNGAISGLAGSCRACWSL